MTDVHKTGSLVPLKVDLDLMLMAEGPVSFEAALKNIPDLGDYIGGRAGLNRNITAY